MSLADEVRDANKNHHDSIDPETYGENESLFSPHRQRSIRNFLEDLGNGKDMFLDIGCGTGNVVRLAEDLFETVVGVDVSVNMLKQAHEQSDASFLAGDGLSLPFPDESFEMISLYATLHHTPAPQKFLTEASRVLKKGGRLYTGHDPNYYLVRFYFPLFKLIHLGRSGFGDSRGDLAEYYHTQEPGIDPEPLAEHLESLGYREVEIQYRRTDNPNLSGFKTLIKQALETVACVYDPPSFNTHFSIRAIK
ncbi:MAG: class I SAM-dependent methyltransferase [bacterium]